MPEIFDWLFREKAFAVSPVLKPLHTLSALENGWWGYRNYFLKKWQKSVIRKADCFPDLYDREALSTKHTLSSLTGVMIQKYSDYPDMISYFNDYDITGSYLENLGVSSKLITSLDDPVIPASDLKFLASPKTLTVETTKYGGHCGFFEAFNRPSFVDHQMLKFFTRN